MKFGQALEALEDGYTVQRKGWNGKGMWLTLVQGSRVIPTLNSPYEEAGIHDPIDIDPHIDMFTAGKTMQPGWLASQADMLADDWQLVS